VNKKSEQKSAINGLVTAIVCCYINLNFTDSGDTIFLSRKSEPATEKDIQVVFDLIDTLRAHAHECVGMAANMIGVKKENYHIQHRCGTN